MKLLKRFSLMAEIAHNNDLVEAASVGQVSEKYMPTWQKLVDDSNKRIKKLQKELKKK